MKIEPVRYCIVFYTCFFLRLAVIKQYKIWSLLKTFSRIIVFVKSASFRCRLVESVGEIISLLKLRVFNNNPMPPKMYFFSHICSRKHVRPLYTMNTNKNVLDLTFYPKLSKTRFMNLSISLECLRFFEVYSLTVFEHIHINVCVCVRVHVNTYMNIN